MVIQTTKVIQMLDLLASIILNSSNGCQPQQALLDCLGKGASVTRLALEGVNPVRPCKKGEPKTDKCSNGSESGGVKLATEKEQDSRGSNRGNDERPKKLAEKKEDVCRYADGSEAPCHGAPEGTKGGSTRLVYS